MEMRSLKDKGIVAEDAKSVVRKHLSNIFADVSACNASAAKDCRQAARADALASGLLSRELFRAKKRGEMRAAAEAWATCLEAEDSSCEDAAKTLFQRVSGSSDAQSWNDWARNKSKELADAIVSGEPTVMKLLQQLSVDFRMSGSLCSDDTSTALEGKVEGLTGTKTLQDACRAVDSKAEYSMEVPDNNDEATLEERSEKLFTDLDQLQANAGRRLAETAEEVGVDQGVEECPESAAGCGNSVAAATSSAFPSQIAQGAFLLAASLF